MGEKMPDRRIRKTRKAVQEALLELLSEKGLAEITVLELTERADINRKTFYNHYADIHAVLDELEDQMVEKLMETLEELLHDKKGNEFIKPEQIEAHLKEVAYPYFKTFITHLQENPSFYSISVNCGDRARLRKKIVLREKELFLQIYGDQAKNAVWLDYFLMFIVNGSFAVFENWMKEGERVSVDDLARFFSMLFTTENVSSFLI